MTGPKSPADNGYDASILEVLAGLDPPPPRSSAMLGDEAGCIAAIDESYAREEIAADEMAAQLARLRR